eukprot:537735_1
MSLSLFCPTAYERIYNLPEIEVESETETEIDTNRSQDDIDLSVGSMHVKSLDFFKSNIDDIVSDMMFNDKYKMLITNYCKHDIFLYRYNVSEDDLMPIMDDNYTLKPNHIFSIDVTGCWPVFIAMNEENRQNNDDIIYMIYIPISTQHRIHHIIIYSITTYTISNTEPSMESILEHQELSTQDLFGVNMVCLFKYSFRIATVFGIKVYLHLSMIICYIFMIFIWTITVFKQHNDTILYDVLLLIIQQICLLESTMIHELGHAFGAYLCHGRTNKIYFWPFGGLTFSVALNPGNKHNCYRLIHTICGPLTHLLHLILFGSILLIFFSDSNYYNGIVILPNLGDDNYQYAFISYIILPNNMKHYNFIYNLFLILFNMHFWLLILNVFYFAYPFDGSKLLVEIFYILNNKSKAIIYFIMNIFTLVFFIVISKIFLFHYTRIFVTLLPAVLWNLYQVILITIYIFQDKVNTHPLIQYSQLFHDH